VADELTREEQRQLGVDLFNHVWTLLENPNRTPEQNDEMLDATYASAYHWSKAGTTANIARSQWQISRVYCELGRPEPALYHAGRCVAYCESDPDAMEDWDLPFAFEALARAHLTAGDTAEAKRVADQTRELAAQIEDEKDREILERDLATLP